MAEIANSYTALGPNENTWKCGSAQWLLAISVPKFPNSGIAAASPNWLTPSPGSKYPDESKSWAIGLLLYRTSEQNASEVTFSSVLRSAAWNRVDCSVILSAEKHVISKAPCVINELSLQLPKLERLDGTIGEASEDELQLLGIVGDGDEFPSVMQR